MFALAFASCDVIGQLPGLDGGDDNKVLNEDIEFTLEIVDIKATSARIKVTHNGADDDTWYAFAAPKTAEILETVSAKVEELQKADKITGLKSRTEYTYAVSGLEESTDYTFIVFGLAENGDFYGVPESIDFTTARGSVEFAKNENWTVTYMGDYTDQETGEVVKNTVLVETTDENKFFFTSFNKAYLGEYDINDIEVLTEVLMLEFDAFSSSFETESEMDAYLHNESGLYVGDVIPGDWYFLVIGVDDNHKLSGHYAISELVNIPEEEATPEYAAWLGDWTFTGENGVAYDVTFKKGLNNLYFLMSGWENVDAEWEADIPVYWDGTKNEWMITNQYFETYDFGGEIGVGDLWVFGTDDESIWSITEQQVGICYSKTEEDGTKTCIGYDLKFQDGSTATMKYMQYIILLANGKLGTISDVTEWPSFPITITKKETAGNVGTTSVKTKAAPAFSYKKARTGNITSELPFRIENNLF